MLTQSWNNVSKLYWGRDGQTSFFSVEVIFRIEENEESSVFLLDICQVIIIMLFVFVIPFNDITTERITAKMVYLSLSRQGSLLHQTEKLGVTCA